MVEIEAQNLNMPSVPDPGERPHMGLVCVTASEEVRFRTITRTRYLKLSATEKEVTLQALYHDNLERLHRALSFCEQHQIKLYRLSSDLFPQSDDEFGTNILEEMADEMGQIGERAREIGIRLVLHPDQFVVLNSESPQIVENSRKILDRHARNLDLFGLERSAWAVMMIHGGKGNRSEQLIQTIGELPEGVRRRLALENDEYTYSAAAILNICHKAGVPMVFDVHHYVCNLGLDSYEDPGLAEMLAAARQTWPKPEWQLVHLSNGKEAFGDRRHSDFIELVPGALRNAPWIEVEAKAKEQAIAHLRLNWPIAD